MVNSFIPTIFVLIAAAMADSSSSSSFSTLTLTTVSSVCPSGYCSASSSIGLSVAIAPSSFGYQNVTKTAARAVAATTEGTSINSATTEAATTTTNSDIRSASTIFATDVVSDASVVNNVHTVCGPDGCYVTTDSGTQTTATTTINDILTTEVTVLPTDPVSLLAEDPVSTAAQDPSAVTQDPSSEADPSTITQDPSSADASEAPSTATVTDIQSTLLTVTSCSDHKCSIETHTTGLTTVTYTIDNVATEYTTYCPLSSETSSAASSKHTEAPETIVTTTKKPYTAPTLLPTINVITNNIVTEGVTSTGSTSTAASTVGQVSSYEGGAGYAGPATGVVGLLATVWFFLA